MYIKKMGVFLLTTMLLSGMSVQAKTDQEEQVIKEEPIYYEYDYQSRQFIPETNKQAEKKLVQYDRNSYQSISVDGKPYKVRVLSAVYNDTKSKAIPYTELSRMMSVANGQVVQESNTKSYTHTSTISHMKKSNHGFSFGGSSGGIDDAGKEKSVFSSISKNLASFTLSFNLSFDKSYTTTNTETKVRQNSIEDISTYSIPSQFKSCNGLDFYSFSAYDIYDMEIELIDDSYTDNPHKGYTDVIETYMEPVYDYYGQFMGLKCNHCEEMIEVGPGMAIYHVIFKDGHVEHYDQTLFHFEAMDNGIKPYSTDHKTTVTYEYYLPIIKGVASPWYLGQPSTIDIHERAVHLVAPGSEEVVFGGGRHYVFRVLESPLVQPYVTNLPGKQVGDALLPGKTRKIKFSENITIGSSTENITSTTSSQEVKLKFAKWITLNAGYKHESQIVDTSYQSNEEAISMYKESTFSFPSFYQEQGYDGAIVMEAVDILTYRVKGEIIPIKADGSLDENNKYTITLDIEREQPKRYSKPFES